MPSNHLILCYPLLPLPSILPQIRVFSNDSALCIRWPKYWSFSFNISPSNEYSRFISFRIDGLGLVAIQGTQESSPTPYFRSISSLALSFSLKKAMAPHCSTLAWKIPWTEEPGRLQSMVLLSRTQLSNFTFTFHFDALEKEMAGHSSVLAWRIPRMAEPGGLLSMGLQSRT